MITVLTSIGLLDDITYTNVKRYVMSEELADYLSDYP